jgi:hypothetical protein
LNLGCPRDSEAFDLAFDRQAMPAPGIMENDQAVEIVRKRRTDTAAVVAADV